MEPDSDRSNINLSLKIVFVVLFLFLIGELVYFFYIFPNKKITTTIVPTLTPTPILEPTKAPTPVSLTTPPTKQEFTGKIIELDVFKDIPESKNKVKFSFSKENIDKLTIMNLTGKSISYKDLEIGQNIKIVKVYDLKEKIYSSYEITVLN